MTAHLAVVLCLTIPVLPLPCDGANLCAVPMAAGQPAPYDGQLLTPKLALHLGQQAEGCDARLGLLSTRMAQDADIETQRLQAVGAAELKTLRAALKDCDQALTEVQQVLRQQHPWWRSAALWMPVVAVASAGVTAWALGAAGR